MWTSGIISQEIVICWDSIIIFNVKEALNLQESWIIISVFQNRQVLILLFTKIYLLTKNSFISNNYKATEFFIHKQLFLPNILHNWFCELTVKEAFSTPLSPKNGLIITRFYEDLYILVVRAILYKISLAKYMH